MLCLNCDKEITELHLVEKREYTFKGDTVEIEDKFCRCPECQVEWSEEGFDLVAEVFAACRALHPLEPDYLK